MITLLHFKMMYVCIALNNPRVLFSFVKVDVTFFFLDYSGLLTDLWSHTLQTTFLTGLSGRSETYCFWHHNTLK